ncbi:hypothetical protein [Sphingobacterium bambusae]|uniref:Uncharacterized protein n=1 Tax=Sphingobacterium bambusae TaxID=662858 RepID=A0ABW6BLB8_9SPHI|nr:hypothetical protein [Sphingobacterium bambusae]WPL48182.1 hypothetical protein SCB77_19700 [Sphingobacterium bambusae]
MMKIKTLSCVFAVLVLLALGCTKDDSADDQSDNFVERYGGTPFNGNAKGIRLVNGQSNYEWTGDGRIVLMESTVDSVSMLFMADFGDEGEINFKVRGAYQDLNFRAGADDPTQVFAVDDGRVSGKIVNQEQAIDFSGDLQRERASVHMRVEFLEATPVFPANSVLDLHFDTQRKVADGGDTDGCQMRLVPIWSPSGVTMGMVPDC